MSCWTRRAFAAEGLAGGFGKASVCSEGAQADPSCASSHMKKAPSRGDTLQGWSIPVPSKGLGLGQLRHGETKGPAMVETRVDFLVLIPPLKTRGRFIPTEQTGSS